MDLLPNEPAQSASAVAAGWHPDPLGRHQYRYWNGAEWTEHASDNGRQVVDPITPEPRATTPTPDSGRSPASKTTPVDSRTKRNVLIGTGVAIVLLLGAAAVSSPSESDTESQSAELSASGAPSGVLAPGSIDEWQAETAPTLTSLLDDVGLDISEIVAAAGAMDLGELGVACASLGANISLALDLPAIPDAETASSFRTGMTLWRQASEECVTGVATGDVDAINRAAEALEAGSAEINRAQAALEAFVG